MPDPATCLTCRPTHCVPRAGARRPPRGLSLVECCIALAICALSLALAIPGFGSLFERQRLQGSAAQIAADWHWLRSEALARNEPLRLSIHATPQGACTVVHTGPRTECRCVDAGPARCNDSATALQTRHWPASTGITVQASVGSLLFDPAQGTATPTGRLQLADSRGRGITHVVNVLGRVRSCSSGGAVPGYRAC
jgi:type IV fimbrial biogenesis protein FimT